MSASVEQAKERPRWRPPSPAQVFANAGLYIALAMLIVVFAALTPAFLTGGNALNVLQQTSTIGIMAVGQALVILAGGIDVSVGSVVGLGGMVAALLLRDSPEQWPLAIAAGLAAGAGVGLINGLVTCYLRVSPFIVTLATLSAVRGVVYIVSNQFSVRIDAGSGFEKLGQGHFGPIPVSVGVLAVIALAGWALETRTTVGRSIHAIGGNQRAAQLSGVHVNPVRITTYVISGICAALAGVIVASQINLAVPYQGTGDELSVIAAVVVGGVSLRGGTGSVFVAVVGALLIGVLYNGMALLNVPDIWQMVIAGAVIVAAASLYSVARNPLGR
jgi:ribose transport system permease protein